MTAQEIIEKIRSEVERRKKRNKEEYGGNGLFEVQDNLDTLLSFLSDLEKECEEKPTNIDFEQELYKHFGQVKDFTLGMRIGQYFYELGCRRTAEKYDEIEYKRQRADVCEGEEEEYEQIKQKVCSDCPSHKDDYCGYVTRKLQRKCNYLSDVMYGYELGRQNNPKVCEGLEEEILNSYDDSLHERWTKCPYTIFQDIARHFAQWGAEHLKK